jgi:hypothetical protein
MASFLAMRCGVCCRHVGDPFHLNCFSQGALARSLEKRGFTHHKIAEAASISPVELWRLAQYGTKLEPMTALRLCAWLYDLEHPKPLPPLKEVKPGSHHGPGVSAPVRMPTLSFLEARP